MPYYRAYLPRSMPASPRRSLPVLVSAVEDNLAAIAGMVEAVHRREHGTDVELPLWKKL
jgi:hypothetical protein